jgi:hypothetical protein
MNHAIRSCSACQSTKLVRGAIRASASWWGFRIIPYNARTLWGYPLEAMICSACGNVSFCLGPEHLKKIKVEKTVGDCLGLSR